MYHRYQILFGRENDQNLKCTKTTIKLTNLFCNNVEYIGLFKCINYMLLSVIHSKISACFGNKIVQRMHTGNTAALCLGFPSHHTWHYGDVLMGTMVSQTTSLTIVYSTVWSGADQRKHQSSALLAFVRGIYRWSMNSPHKWPVDAENVSIRWHHHELTLAYFGKLLWFSMIPCHLSGPGDLIQNDRRDLEKSRGTSGVSGLYWLWFGMFIEKPMHTSASSGVQK